MNLFPISNYTAEQNTTAGTTVSGFVKELAGTTVSAFAKELAGTTQLDLLRN